MIDVKNEGYNSFDYSVLDSLDKKIPKILFGGVRPEKVIKKIKKYNIKSLAFGNRLNYEEIKIKNIRKLYKNTFRNYE